VFRGRGDPRPNQIDRGGLTTVQTPVLDRECKQAGADLLKLARLRHDSGSWWTPTSLTSEPGADLLQGRVPILRMCWRRGRARVSVPFTIKSLATRIRRGSLERFD